MFTSLKNKCRHIIATVVSYIFSGRESLIQAALIFSTKLILRTVPTNTELIFAPFMTILGKQNLARAVGIQKKNWG